jgi:hypothetical protein
MKDEMDLAIKKKMLEVAFPKDSSLWQTLSS